MFTALVLSISCYSVIAPFMPVVLVEREIDEVVIGIIFAVFSVVVIFGSPCMGYVIKRVGRRKPIIFGCYCVALSL